MVFNHVNNPKMGIGRQLCLSKVQFVVNEMKALTNGGGGVLAEHRPDPLRPGLPDHCIFEAKSSLV